MHSVRWLVLNETGSRLALVEKTKVFVVHLPERFFTYGTSKFDQNLQPSYLCKSVCFIFEKIGNFFHVFYGNCRIVKFCRKVRAKFVCILRQFL